jgi:hypothetical protein
MKTPLGILLLLTVGCAGAEDVRLAGGRVLKAATVQAVHPDGAVIQPAGAAQPTKYPWAWLHAEDAARLRKQAEIQAGGTAEQRLAETVAVIATFRPLHFGEAETRGRVQIYARVEVSPEVVGRGPTIPATYEVRAVGSSFSAVLDQRMPDAVDATSTVPAKLYRIGSTEDSLRTPIFTASWERAAAWLAGKGERAGGQRAARP